MNLLLIDDEKEFVRATKRLLELNHHRVNIAYDGEAGLRLAKSKKYDVILLDIILPKMDGFEVTEKLRERGVTVPILMLTAKSMIDDRVKGLDRGADDYLVKPFAIDELLARIRALTRREKEVRSPVFRAGDLILNPASCEVRRDNRLIQLNNKEYQLLTYLLRNKERVVSREELGRAVWGKKKFSSNTLDVHMRYLRRKIDKNFKTKLIQTIRGRGYKIK